MLSSIHIRIHLTSALPYICINLGLVLFPKHVHLNCVLTASAAPAANSNTDNSALQKFSNE